MVTAFDAETGTEKFTIPEIYEVVNPIYITQHSRKVQIYSVPNSKVNNVGYQGYINTFDLNSKLPLRESYATRSPEQPGMQYNENLRLYGVGSVEKFPVVNVYSVAGGNVIDQYNTRHRTFGAAETDGFRGSTAAFTFLPNSDKMLIGYGNSLIL